MQKAALYFSSVFFTVGAIAHLVRLIAGFEIVIGGYAAPVWVSLPAAFVAALLALWMLIAAQRS
jgi:hypothetical protein